MKNQSLKERIQSEIAESRKSRNELKKNILVLVLGEINLIETKTAKETDDSQVIKIAQKIVKSNLETYSHNKNEDLLKENKYLEELIPKSLSIDEMLEEMDDGFVAKVKSQKKGPAMGMIIGHFKSKGLLVEPKDVGELVSQLSKENQEIL